MKATTLARKIVDWMELYDPWTLSDAYSDPQEAIEDTICMVETHPQDLIDWFSVTLQDLDDEDQQTVAALIIALQAFR